MNRARVAFSATLVATTLATGTALAGQAAQAPPMTSVLAGKKFTPPIKGEAIIEFTQPVTKREKDMVVTRITVRNASVGPVPRLTVSRNLVRQGRRHRHRRKRRHQRSAAARRDPGHHDRDAVQREDERQPVQLLARQRHGEAGESGEARSPEGRRGGGQGAAKAHRHRSSDEEAGRHGSTTDSLAHGSQKAGRHGRAGLLSERRCRPRAC